MKKVLLLAALLTPTLALATGITEGASCDFPSLFNTWTASGFSCTVGDKMFSNFTYTGAIPTNTSLNISTANVVGVGDVFTVAFSGSFTNAFSVSYNISILPDFVNAGWRITRISGDLSVPVSVTGPTLQKQIYDSTGTTLINTVNAAVGSPGSVNVSGTSFRIVDNFAANGGQATNIGNSFVQSQVPEPMTFVLSGCGLLALGLLKRKKA
jgi:hypothetical protein